MEICGWIYSLQSRGLRTYDYSSFKQDFMTSFLLLNLSGCLEWSSARVVNFGQKSVRSSLISNKEKESSKDYLGSCELGRLARVDSISISRSPTDCNIF